VIACTGIVVAGAAKARPAMTILSGQNGDAPPVWNVIAQAQSVIAMKQAIGHLERRSHRSGWPMASFAHATLAMTMGSGDHAKRAIAL